MKRIALVWVVLAAAVAVPAAAADGLPVLGVDVSRVGVVSPLGSRYVTMAAGAGTVVARIDAHSGKIFASRLLRGQLTIPAVAYDGSASGLSADGRTLVLIEPRRSFPREQTTLAVLDAPHVRLVDTIRLRGDFSFDAVSPHGGLLYLIQYVNPQDATRYLVRAYDLRAGRLLAAPVVDPAETGVMRGQPLTRATSPNGRWAYTLYDGSGKTPFVHALDTQRLTAHCVDLDALVGKDLSVIRFNILVGPGGRTLTVRNGLEPLVLVDTRTFRTSAPPAAAPPAATKQTSQRPWTPLAAAVGLAALAVLAFAWRRRRRRQLALLEELWLQPDAPVDAGDGAAADPDRPVGVL